MTTLKRFAGPTFALALLLYLSVGSTSLAVVLFVLPLLAVFLGAAALLTRAGSRFAAGPPPELDGATWSATVTLAGPGIPIGGLLVVWPDRVGFVPSDKATRKGLVAWQLRSEELTGVEVLRGVAGAWISVRCEGGSQTFVCWRWQGCREAVAALGVSVR